MTRETTRAHASDAVRCHGTRHGMSTSIYKYLGSSYLDHVLGSTDRVTLKCSYPKAFNDPYELFLTVDFSDDPEALAFYIQNGI